MRILKDSDIEPIDEIDAIKITIATDKNTDKAVLGVYSDLTEDEVTEIIYALYEQRVRHVESLKSKMQDNMHGDSNLLKSELLNSSVKIMNPINKSND